MPDMNGRGVVDITLHRAVWVRFLPAGEIPDLPTVTYLRKALINRQVVSLPSHASLPNRWETESRISLKESIYEDTLITGIYKEVADVR